MALDGYVRNIGIAPIVNGSGLLWPGQIGVPVATVPAYAGYFAQRQSRFYMRGLRRGGIYLDDIPTVFLWSDNNPDCEDIWGA